MRRKASPPAGGRAPLEELRAAIASVTGSPTPPDVLGKFSRYLSLLAKWNSVHRLIGPRSDMAIVRELFIDSLAFLKVLPSGSISVVDLGTGVGIPGVPIRLVRPEIGLTLVESRRKCVSFLGELKREVGLSDVKVMEGRAEELVGQGKEVRGAFDVAISRAVGAAILGAARAWIKPDGRVILSGPPPGTSTPDPRADLEEVVVVGPRGRRGFLISRKT